MLDHIGGIPDGHIVEFPHSARTFMKVCTIEGLGGVVDIVTGELIMVSDLPRYGLDVWCSERYGERATIHYEETSFPPDFDEMATNGFRG